MSVTIIAGAQWGDEGKGKVVDWLAQDADLVIRYQGGDNAGHTVDNDHGSFGLHLVPCGIFNPGSLCLLGTGMAINPAKLIGELDELESHKISTAGLRISQRAHLLMPYHLVLDRLEEQMRGSYRAGTTMRGVGPAYADKVRRIGIRAGDLLDLRVLAERLTITLEQNNRLIAALAAEEPRFSHAELLEQCRRWAERLGPLIVDDVELTQRYLAESRNILLEGQLGIMRDLDWGIYPYVTSSSPTAGGAVVGAGIAPHHINRVIGVVKAYSSSVGTGPLITELENADGEKLREQGGEYGTTTGRPRRCGWFDAVAVRYAARLNGFSQLAVTKLDVLSRFPALKICTAYRAGEQVYTLPPTGLMHQVTLEPVYEELPGWEEDISGCRSFGELPPAAQRYLKRLSQLADTAISMVSVGPHRDASFIVDLQANG